MRAFMDQDFLLETETARHLYHDYAAPMGIIDYHCHISPREICEDRKFHNLAEVWLGGKNPDGSYFGDHYKWRIMRSHGVPEELVTGDAEPFAKFEAFAGALEMAIGNPMYHWCHLELQKYFGVTEPLNRASARRIWDACNDKLQNDPACTVRGIIRSSHVVYIGTTDDPTDDLCYHQKIALDPTVDFQVCPSFRPDKVINLQRPGFAAYLQKLAACVGKVSLGTIDDLFQALDARIAHFKAHGCRASDHGLDTIVYRPCDKKTANAILQKAILGKNLTQEEIEQYQTIVLLHLAEQYCREGIVMEIHFSCLRNVNTRMFALEGPDTGFDMIAKSNCGEAMARFLSDLDARGCLPRTILFSLDHTDFNLIGTCMGAFQSDEVPGKIQMGPAWWFLDTKDGMEEQMRSLANLGLLGDFVGMLTDSRSFLSYTRHEYFRRIACNLIGHWVESGQYPADEAALQTIVQGISYQNATRYFYIN